MSLTRLADLCMFVESLERANERPFLNHGAGASAIAVRLAELAERPQEEIEILKLATRLHDFGKLALPATLLNSPTRLTRAQEAMMHSHTIIGWELFKTYNFEKEIEDIALPVLRSHHEHWDGSGYPDGLRHWQIPVQARIVCIADSYDAIEVDGRPYQNGPTPDPLKKLLEHSEWYDPDLLALFVGMVGK